MSSLKDVSLKDVGLKDVSLKDVVVPNISVQIMRTQIVWMFCLLSLYQVGTPTNHYHNCASKHIKNR